MADPAVGLVLRVELAFRHLGLPDGRPGRLATARAGAGLVEDLRRAGGRVRLVETLARAELPATDTAVATSLKRAEAVASAVDAFRWDRLGPLRAAEDQDDDRGRDAVRALRTLREAVGADEFATRLGPALSAAEDAVFEWLSAGQRAEPVPPPPVRRPDDVPHLRAAAPAAAGPAGPAAAKGAPASEVLGPLKEFLEKHRDDQVVVEWRVQE